MNLAQNLLAKGKGIANSLLGGTQKPSMAKPQMQKPSSAMNDAIAMNDANTKARRLLGK